jgi:hypothetical protein
MRVRAPAPTRLARAVLVGASAWVGAGECVAASCPVELRGAPSEAWLRAGRAIEALTMDPSDCARIELELEQSTGAARLTFVTRDGRRAERRLAHPDELMPTVVALGIQGPTEGSTPVLEDRPMAPTRTADAVSPLDSPPSEPAAPHREARAHFALLGGARAGAGHLVSPVLGGAAAIALDRWELGINLALELEYSNLRPSKAVEPSSAVSVGVFAGRREAIADVELLFGARSMVAAVNDDSQEASGEAVRAELRLGAYLGGVWPRQSSPRFRADLALDVVPHESQAASGPPVTPWLAASALLGVEVGGP